MRYPHTVVWIDHNNADVIHYTPDAYHRQQFESGRRDRQVHRKSGVPGTGKQPSDLELYSEVGDELDAHATTILIVGPGTAKHSFERFLREARPSVAARIAAVDAIDHPSINQLLGYARHRFLALDRMAGTPAK